MAVAAEIPSASHPLDQEISASTLRQQIEEDWLRQAKAHVERQAGPVSTRTDALGACDGIKNGQYGFHTGLEPNPWWQVDLEKITPISRITVFNRLDYAPGLHNADHLRILTSEDGKRWALRHENTKHFGGISGAKPLEVIFSDGVLGTARPTNARFVRLQAVSEKPIFFHLDEVEIYGPDDNSRNLALHRPADQSSISQWSTAKSRRGTNTLAAYPTEQVLQRGKRLAADLQQKGVDVREALSALEDLERQCRALPANAADEVRHSLYLKTRWQMRRLAFSNPLLNFDRLLFVKRFTQETYPDICLNHMPWVSRPGGDICILNLYPNPNLNLNLNPSYPLSPSDGERAGVRGHSALSIRHLLNRALGPGHVHGMDLSWDANRIVFAYARAKSDQPPKGWLDRTRSYDLRRTEEPIHIFEIGIKGDNLRQLTRGEWSDLDPTYAPNGDIVFVSERCATSLQCNEYDKDETSCNLYVMKPDGSGIRRLSVSKDGDYLPHTLDDGTIAYTRWEYHERSWAFIQSIWVIRPDGTSADAIFKQHFVNPWALEDTRSIPGSSKLVAIAAGHHTLAAGPLVVVNPSVGINDPRGIAIVTPDVMPPEGGVADHGGYYSTPWALSEKYFLVSYTYAQQQTDPAGYALYLVDVFGNKELLYRDPAISCFIPIPLRPRPRPPIYPEMADLTKNYAVCALSDASFGSEGIAPGQARYIRIAEPIGWPYDNTRGGQRYGEDHGYAGPDAERKNLLSWTPIRILGDVPLEPDGSAHFKVPTDTAVYFQLLDENRMELRRMRSFISFQPGEVRACAGCHESRGAAPVSRKDSLALRREPSEPIPPPWGDRPMSFLRDIQPVFDRHCVRCHHGLKPAGGLDFGSGLISYDPRIAGYGHNRAYETIMEKGLAAISKVRTQDASITPPLAYGARLSKLLTALRREPHDKEVQLGSEDQLRLAIWIDANAPYHDKFVNKRPDQPAYDLASEQALLKHMTAVHERRCANCHKSSEISRLDWIDLHQVEQSLFLAAPLAAGPGATNHCPGAVYKNTSDADYQALLASVKAAVQKARQAPRRDMESILVKK